MHNTDATANTWALLFTGLVFIFGVLVGVGLMKSAHADEAAGVAHALPVAVNDDGDSLGIPLVLPEGEEVWNPEADDDGVTDPDSFAGRPGQTLRGWPSRAARFGRPLDGALVARKLSFRARFADFPEYVPEPEAPTLRGVQ